MRSVLEDGRQVSRTVRAPQIGDKAWPTIGERSTLDLQPSRDECLAHIARLVIELHTVLVPEQRPRVAIRGF